MSRRLVISTEKGKQETSLTRHLASIDSLETITKATRQDYPFYGLLLPKPSASPVNDYVRTRWEGLHAMSGENCLLLTTLIPERPTEDMQAFLTQLVGKKKSQALWRRYQYTPEQVANDVFLLAQKLRIDYDRLPCLVYMSSLTSNEQLFQRLPEWDETHLEHFFTTLFTRVNRHAQDDSTTRLKGLEKELGRTFLTQLQVQLAIQGFQDKLADLSWTEVVQSTLTNQELITSVFKFLATLWGAPS